MEIQKFILRSKRELVYDAQYQERTAIIEEIVTKYTTSMEGFIQFSMEAVTVAKTYQPAVRIPLPPIPVYTPSEVDPKIFSSQYSKGADRSGSSANIEAVYMLQLAAMQENPRYGSVGTDWELVKVLPSEDPVPR